MKKLITLIIVVGLLMSANVSYGFGDITVEGGKGGKGGDASATVGDVSATGGSVGDTSATAGSSAINNTGNVSVEIEASPLMPAPVLPVPGFVAPANESIDYWTTSPFDTKARRFTVKKLTRFANPSRLLLWPDWNKSFEIEVAVWEKISSGKSVIVVNSMNTDVVTSLLVNRTRIGEAHARAKQLNKSENQVAAALAVQAVKAGASVVVIRSFSTPVTKATTAVLGGAGANVGQYNVINGAGGFGTSTAEKVGRAYVVAELYR